MALNYRRLALFASFYRTGFLAWLRENEHIYAAFEARAFVLINRGTQHFSARMVIHELRHNTAEAEGGGPFKINDHRSPDLARVFVILYPEHAHFWEYRRSDWPEFLAAVASTKGRFRA